MGSLPVRHSWFATRGSGVPIPSAPHVPSTIAIDWAFLGHAAVGEEVGPLVIASFALGDVDLVAARESSVLDGYLEGLSNGGVQLDERIVRLGYAISACLRYSIGPPETILPSLLDDERRTRLAEFFGQLIADVCRGMLARRRTLLRPLLDEAKELADQLQIA